MAAEAAALLDELMGRNRNANPHEKSGTIKWDHAEVCKHFLCGYCPNELFVNTKADLGPCNLIHDEPLKREYQSSSRFEKMGYEEKWIEELESIVNDVDKKIKRGHQRLAMTQNSDSSPSHGTPGPRQEQIMQLTEKIDDLVEKAEKLGNEGKVEEAQGVMKLCDQLKKERQQFENLSNDHLNNPHLAKQMEVCPICGAFLIVGDAESRQREHLMGKQHMGYAQMRATVEQFKEQKRQKIAAHKAEMEKKREEERKKVEERERSRRRSRSRDRKDRRRPSPGRRRSRSRERRRSKSRERRRSRSKDRHRSRSRDRGARDRTNGRRSRSRDRRQSDRGGRENRRDSSRGRRDRSRERDSEKTSKSNDSDRNKRKDGSRSRSRDRSKEKSDAKEIYDTKEQKVTNGDKHQSNDDKNMDEDMQDSGQHSNDEGTRDSNTTYNSM